jgi:glucose-1-phosphate cytidylyltransferase
MKLVILAGGLGTRISEETEIRPKPMVEIGGKPILWHIMKLYSAYGVNDFVICCGYKGYVIKEYFANYGLHHSDVTFDLRNNAMECHERRAEPWRITLVDTGEETMTGGRLKRVRHHLTDGTFCFTYGDGVGNVNINDLVAFHRKHGKIATMTAMLPPGRFGALQMEHNSDRVQSFREKPEGDGGWVNGGFFVLEPQAIDYVEGDPTVWEKEPLERLARDGQLHAFRHAGFWQPMDTLRDKKYLEDLWKSGKAPWKVWTNNQSGPSASR